MLTAGITLFATLGGALLQSRHEWSPEAKYVGAATGFAAGFIMASAIAVWQGFLPRLD